MGGVSTTNQVTPHPLAVSSACQVTNPAIDPYRESLVMSIEVYLGRQGVGLDQWQNGWHQLDVMK